jgi:hypothetical protein
VPHVGHERVEVLLDALEARLVAPVREGDEREEQHEGEEEGQQHEQQEADEADVALRLDAQRRRLADERVGARGVPA